MRRLESSQAKEIQVDGGGAETTTKVMPPVGRLPSGIGRGRWTLLFPALGNET
jgi:hypothetical protein